MDNPKFTIFRSSDNLFYFRLSSGNGEIILSSKGYSSKQNCRDGIASVKLNAPIDRRYQRIDLIICRFTLKAENGEIIARSETYNSTIARENGIAAVKRDAPDAPIDDIS